VTACGFFGKLPSRGDFVRAGLPRSFTDAWDAWMREVLPASRAILGEAWVPAWLEAPVWRFALPPGTCGPEWVLGLWMPSMDSAGRYFPLVLARTGGDRELPNDDFLSMAEGVGRAAIADDWPPNKLTKRLAGKPLEPVATSHFSAFDGPSRDGEERSGVVSRSGSDTRWWTEGSPRRPACRLISAGLPCSSTFARMLDQRGAEAYADPLPRGE
jgi:type VI secretion system protein ImpM